MSDMETKQILGAELKAVSSKEGKEKRFEGYLAYFNNVDLGGDIIEKGAFLNSLREKKEEGKYVPILEQHGGYGLSATDKTPIGYYEELIEDEKGLFAKGVLFDTQRGADIHTMLKQAPKSFMGQSIGYNIIGKKNPTEEEYRQKGVVRILTELKLNEGSIVTFPMNELARVDDVKMAEAKKLRGLEDHFRKNGFSASEAKKAVALLKSYESISEELEEKSTEDLTSVTDVFKKFSEQLEQEQIMEEVKKALAEFPSQVNLGRTS